MYSVSRVGVCTLHFDVVGGSGIKSSEVAQCTAEDAANDDKLAFGGVSARASEEYVSFALVPRATAAALIALIDLSRRELNASTIILCAARRPVPPLRAGRDSRTTAIFPRLRRRDNCPRAPATEWCETAAFITLGQKTPRRRASPLLCRIRITRSGLEGQRRLRPRVFGGNYSPFLNYSARRVQILSTTPLTVVSMGVGVSFSEMCWGDRKSKIRLSIRKRIY